MAANGRRCNASGLKTKCARFHGIKVTGTYPWSGACHCLEKQHFFCKNMCQKCVWWMFLLKIWGTQRHRFWDAAIVFTLFLDKTEGKHSQNVYFQAPDASHLNTAVRRATDLLCPQMLGCCRVVTCSWMGPFRFANQVCWRHGITPNLWFFWLRVANPSLVQPFCKSKFENAG